MRRVIRFLNQSSPSGASFAAQCFHPFVVPQFYFIARNYRDPLAAQLSLTDGNRCTLPARHEPKSKMRINNVSTRTISTLQFPLTRNFRKKTSPRKLSHGVALCCALLVIVVPNLNDFGFLLLSHIFGTVTTVVVCAPRAARLCVYFRCHSESQTYHISGHGSAAPKWSTNTRNSQIISAQCAKDGELMKGTPERPRPAVINHRM